LAGNCDEFGVRIRCDLTWKFRMSDLTNDALTDRPQWAKDAVFYQIFPDRFARGGGTTVGGNLLAWHAAPTSQGFFGGDLSGIVERLDYLVDLGVNAIYLTPIFQSACNHRYHTHDYWTVDPLLGGNAAFRELVAAVHGRGMRIMLDGVFNHASRGFFPFHDILENGPHSPWLSWFHILGWPLSPYDGRKPANYVCWANNRALPKFNTDNPRVREFLMRVGEFWVRDYDIDGWRLDVPTQVTTPGFWEEFRARTRAIKPDLYLVGEIWRQAADWLRGDRFDATMNYEFAAAAIAFAGGRRVSENLVRDRSYDPFPGIDAGGLGERLARLLALYDWETTQVQFNLLASHDAPRVVSVARGDRTTLRLATLLQLTFPGTPSIYYGDEIALRGTKRYDRPHRDMDARWPFPWHDERLWDQEMLRYFRQLIALRRAHPALRRGQFTQLHAEGDVYAFHRNDHDESLLVILNAGDGPATVRLAVKPGTRDGMRFGSVFGPPVEAPVQGGWITVAIPARSGCVLAETR
jgi:cyclomaltodextrinase / maltogenic alpha-amylase / neopullulanase